jgi:hypothetical protein
MHTTILMVATLPLDRPTAVGNSNRAQIAGSG